MRATVRRRIAAALLIPAVLVAACSPRAVAPRASAPAKPPATSAAANPGAILTRDNLPTAVGTKWTIVSSPGPVKLDLSVAGPWRITDGPDWVAARHEIVDASKLPGMEVFKNVTFVDKTVREGGGTTYFIRSVSDEWVDHLGKIEVVNGTTSQAQPTAAPEHFWPLRLTKGREYTVAASGPYRITAKVLAVNTAEVPAGRIENTALVRFDYTPLESKDSKPSAYYYMFAPGVGFVALIHPSAGTEASGFTAAESVAVLKTLPKK